jgi:hypothetical protein
VISPTRLFTTAFKDVQGLAQGFTPQAAKAAESAAKAVEAVPHSLPGTAAAFGGAAPAVGKAASIGGLSVPAAWAGGAPTASPAVVTLNGLGAAVGAEPAANTFGGLPVMGSGADAA